MPIVAAILFAAAARVPGQAQAPDQTAHAAAILAAIAAHDFSGVEAQFDDAMKAALPAGRLAAAWDGLIAQAGAVKRCGGDGRVRAIDGKQMVITPCAFERAAFDVQIAFDGANRISGMTFRPAGTVPAAAALPPYAVPGSFRESAVTVGAGGDWPLPGTLSMPVGAGPFPAVVLVHGSGPNDRDETVGANRPFADLAAGLASRGVAVLRYDKRSRVYGARMAVLPRITVNDEVIEDALAAVTVLRAARGVDPARVFVLGHSLGAMLVPRIAAADARLAGAVVMAGPARPIERAIVDQLTYLAEADGSVTPEERARIDAAATTAAAIASLTPADAAAGRRILNAPAAYWLDLRGYDPPAAAASVRVPLLVLQGERDYQVTMAEFARWRSALAGRADVTFKSYPSLNHLFIAGSGTSLPAEYDRPSHVAQPVVDNVACWIAATCR